jgi:hypothetical protein
MRDTEGLMAATAPRTRAGMAARARGWPEFRDARERFLMALRAQSEVARLEAAYTRADAAECPPEER